MVLGSDAPTRAGADPRGLRPSVAWFFVSVWRPTDLCPRAAKSRPMGGMGSRTADRRTIGCEGDRKPTVPGQLEHAGRCPFRHRLLSAARASTATVIRRLHARG